MAKFKYLIPQIIVICASIFFYFYLRLNFRESIFFGFDMPRVALIVQDFLQNGTYISSQSYMQESVWRNVPWGPSLVFFYSFFIKVSSDPLVVANLLSIFNFLSIILITYLGWKYFSPTVGSLSGLMLATQPYWVTYSRIIYQPAPLITFEILSMYALIAVIRNKSKVGSLILPLTWVILFQIYIPTYAFILVSLIFVILSYKNINYKYFFIGLLLSFILFLPTVYFYFNNPEYITRFIEAPSLFTPPEKTVIERLSKVLYSFINIPMGGYFKWQTGYAYDDFLNYFPLLKTFCLFNTAVFTLAILYSLFNLLVKKTNQLKQLIFWWTIVVVFSLMILWVTDLVPRYFLIAIPPTILLISIFINDLMVNFKGNNVIKVILFLVPVAISIYWLIFNIKYDNFVKKYDYPNGKLYDVAETPYIHFKNSSDFVKSEAEKDFCTKYHISNDLNDINSVWMETTYLRKYVYNNINYDAKDIESNCIYYVVYNNITLGQKYNFLSNRQFGPFFVVKNSEVF